jgi:hypothetical protein
VAIQKHDPHWWSDIFQTEFRLPQRRYRRLCIWPPQYVRVGSNRVASARDITKAFLVKVRGFFCHQPPATSAVSCADPLDAYMHACIAATLFCYASPAIYGLAGTMEEQGVSWRNHESGDDL